jgi:hypothetical protein
LDAVTASPIIEFAEFTNPPLEIVRLLPLPSLPTVRLPALFQVEGIKPLYENVT